jgi:peroxiredoxin
MAESSGIAGKSELEEHIVCALAQSCGDGFCRGAKEQCRAMPATFVAENARQAFEHARDMDASMNERLASYADFIRAHHPQAVAIVERMLNRLRINGAGEAAPKPGDIMPPFMLPDETGRMVSLQELLKAGPTIVTFHRGHWCPYCRISINTLARAYARIQQLGASMVAVVPERHQFAEELRADSNVRFPVLSDMDNGYALSLNLVISVGPEMETFMQSIGRRLPDYQGNDSWMLPIPATFVIGQDGRIKDRFVDPDFRKRMAVEALIAALK